MLVRFQPGLPSIFNRQIWRILYLAPVAQRIRALVFGTRCHRFESCRVYHKKEVLALRFLLVPRVFVEYGIFFENPQDLNRWVRPMPGRLRRRRIVYILSGVP